MRNRVFSCWLTSGLFLVFAASAMANSFTVVNSGASDYLINGVADPTLTLYRGRTYSFSINASGHPFWIKTNAVTGTGSAYNDGVTGNGTQVGTLTFTVPTNAPSLLFYICQFHSTMQGQFNVADSPQAGWWRFEQIGTNALDSSGRGLHGIITNQNAGLDDGVSGYSTDVPGAFIVDGNLTNANTRSFRFAKSQPTIPIVNPSLFRLTNNPATVTIEAFVRASSDKWPMRIVDIRRVGLPEPPPRTLLSPFLSDIGPAPWLSFSIHSDQTTNYTTLSGDVLNPSPIAVGHWHHIAFVVETNRLLFYVDYQFAGDSAPYTYVPGSFTNINSFVIGGIAADPFNAFDGWMDEVRITESALAPTQFLRVVNGLAPGFRSFSASAAEAQMTIVTESGALYRIQSSTNLISPQVWTNVGGIFTGRTFYTTVTNSGAPSPYYRAVRNP